MAQTLITSGIIQNRLICVPPQAPGMAAGAWSYMMSGGRELALSDVHRLGVGPDKAAPIRCRVSARGSGRGAVRHAQPAAPGPRSRWRLTVLRVDDTFNIEGVDQLPGIGAAFDLAGDGNGTLIAATSYA